MTYMPADTYYPMLCYQIPCTYYTVCSSLLGTLHPRSSPSISPVTSPLIVKTLLRIHSTSIRRRSTVDQTLNAGESMSLPSWTAPFVYTPYQINNQHLTLKQGIGIGDREECGRYPRKNQRPSRQRKPHPLPTTILHLEGIHNTHTGKKPPERAKAPSK